ncbi:MAG: hypothetical protein ACK4VP_08845, partial [Nitrospira sp.]
FLITATRIQVPVQRGLHRTGPLQRRQPSEGKLTLYLSLGKRTGVGRYNMGLSPRQVGIITL